MDTRHIKKLKAFMVCAIAMSSLSTCKRRQVGCILLDDNYKIIGSGYNGNPTGFIHCIDKPCAGSGCKSGTGLDECEAIHAEQNALMQCTNVNDIAYCVTTTFPCAHCLKMLLNTGCKCIVYQNDYVNITKHLWKYEVVKI